MAMFTFGKKKEQPFSQESMPFPSELPSDFPQEPAGSRLPVDQINNLRSQGLTDNQIIQNLQRDGYTSDQVFEALTQAGMQAAGPLPMSQAPQGSPMPPMMQGSPGTVPDIGSERERIEELAEAIIDEKWEELIKNLNKIVEWKDKTEAIIAKLQQQIDDTKAGFDKLHAAIIGKISEYDQNILNVGTEIKAMEKVFQKVIPTFTENISELDRITRRMKVSGGRSKSRNSEGSNEKD